MSTCGKDGNPPKGKGKDAEVKESFRFSFAGTLENIYRTVTVMWSAIEILPYLYMAWIEFWDSTRAILFCLFYCP